MGLSRKTRGAIEIASGVTCYALTGTMGGFSGRWTTAE
jgi:hypothetical protein